MERVLPYVGLLAGLLLVVLGATIAENIPLPTAPPPRTATSTGAIIPSVSVLPPPSVAPSPTVSTATPVVAKAPTRRTKPPAISISIPALPVIQTAPTIDVPSALAAAADMLRSALVNILCYSPAGSGLGSISGSGVFIDSRGIVLTNAHIAEYFLLSDQGVSCVIRSGSPAVSRYQGALIFISPAWLSANASVLKQQNPIGTGERDFALVAVTKSITNDPLPASFPYVPLATIPPSAGTPVVIGSYGAQFLQSAQILSGLSPTLVYGSVRNIYTFDSNTIDVLDLGGSAAAQEGSSGGGIVTADGELSGTIVTSTVEGETASRQLDAITASYIRADYATENGVALDVFLSQPLSLSIADFAAVAPALKSILAPYL